ncbi:hypothetical protein [Halobacillus kuroshimensis]|uniref:hypothetical protein n=1 Tax=Halobacillus kuroshimensis TaxID=302481 RepID=UPI0004803575|nr:hypothetical protein [Halobacillus kuroshimensis]
MKENKVDKVRQMGLYGVEKLGEVSKDAAAPVIEFFKAFGKDIDSGDNFRNKVIELNPDNQEVASKALKQRTTETLIRYSAVLGVAVTTAIFYKNGKS